MESNKGTIEAFFRVLIIALFVFVNNCAKDELGIRQPRVVREPGWLMESFEKKGISVERKCVRILMYEGKLPEPCPTESYAAYRLYQCWKRRNGLY